MTRDPKDTDKTTTDITRRGGRERVRFINKDGRGMMSTASLRRLPVYDGDGRYLGVLKDMMVETDRGTVAYVVLLFENNKTFALPFNALMIDPESGTIRVNVRHEVFEDSSGMSKTQADNR